MLFIELIKLLYKNNFYIHLNVYRSIQQLNDFITSEQVQFAKCETKDK